ncbi:MAG: bile acid:sodium symporter family protein [Croceibacterium sp.]
MSRQMKGGAAILRWMDPFLLGLIGVVVLASLVPVRGEVAGVTTVLASVGIGLLFFLNGAKLSRRAILQGIGNWRLHALTLGSTYLLFPAIGLTLAWLGRGWINPLLLSGLLFLTLLPSTVQSSIAFTAMAGGNVAAAICSASLSNLAGIFVTPLLAGVFMHVGSHAVGSSAHSLQSIALQLLAPFLAGHLLRPVIGGFVDRNHKLLMPVDRGLILLVVFSAFSAAVVNGIWTRVGWLDMAELVGLSGLILAIVIGVNATVSRLFGFRRDETIVLMFCGSKKSLVSGVPMAGILFPPAQVGLIILPLMIFHQLQLFVSAALAARFRRDAEQRSRSETAQPAFESETPATPQVQER